MKPFRRAMVALSNTASDAELLRYAALAARTCALRDVRFVHVVTEPHRPRDGVDVPRLVGQIRDEVERHFGSLDGVSTAVHVCEGVRVDELIEFAVSEEVDLILLGHRKLRSGRRSLARRLAMIAPCSIWLVPEGAPCRISSILAPIDFSDHSADSLELALELARRGGIEQCFALHVFFDPSTVRYDEHIDEVRGNEERMLARFLEPIDTRGVRVEPVFEESTHVGQAILRSTGKQQADLIVMSTRGRSRAAAILLGSVTSQTIMETTVPVLAVKHFGAQLKLFRALFSKEVWQRSNPKSN